MSHTILTDILIIFIVAVPVAFAFHKLRLPPIIGILVTGALIGPAFLGFVQDTDRINLLAQIGVALLVFSIGLEFSLKHFGEVKRVSFYGGALQILLTTGIALGVCLLTGLEWRDGLFLGCAISLSSTVIVYNFFVQKRLVDSPHGRIAIGMLILQDLSAIPMVALLPVALSPIGDIDLITVLSAIVRLLLVAAIFLAGMKFVLPHLLHQVTLTKSKELFLITILLLALGFGYLTNALGLSFALGAFLAGLMVADTDFRFHALSEIAPFRYCFSGLFFVSIGMLVNPSFFSSHWWWIPVIALALPVGKAIITTLVILFFGYPLSVAGLAGLALAQVGEFSFVIAVAAKHAGIITGELYDFTITAAFVTILMTPLIISASPHIVKMLDRTLPFSKARRARSVSAIDADHLDKHVIICGFGPLGSSVGHILDQAERDYLVLELNPATVRRLKSKDKPVYLGDGASVEILYKSGIERASVLAITAPDYMNNIVIIKQARSMNPELKIITRAKFRNQVEDLYAAGADIVISEELEAGVEMGRYILVSMGIDDSVIENFIKTIRAFGSADFF